MKINNMSWTNERIFKNNKVKIYEKNYYVYSTGIGHRNVYEGIITNIIDDRFIELDRKILIAIDFIYMIEIVD